MDSQIHYVYAHYLRGSLVYIGKGTRGRALDRSRRSKKWKNIIGRESIVAQILKFFDNEKEAFLYESLKIKELKPIANQMLNGWVPSEYARSVASKTFKGVPISIERRNHLSSIKKGIKPKTKRTRDSFSDEEILRIKKMSSRKVFCLNNEKEYASCSDAARDIGLASYKCVWKVASGQIKSYRGFLFKFIQ